MNNKEKQAQREREVLDRVRSFLRDSQCDSRFGFTEADWLELVHVFDGLEQNPETKYPDFYGPYGCVELFEVSSSPEGKRGGPQQKVEDGKLSKKISEEDEEASMAGDRTSRQYLCKRPKHSHDALVEHIKKQFKKHVESMSKSGQDDTVTVFVIELRDPDLECMFAPAGRSIADGVGVGDLWPVYSKGKPRGLYRLSRDKEALRRLAQHKEGVRYIIFIGPDGIEAINLGRVDALLPFIPWDLAAYGRSGFTTVSSISVAIVPEAHGE